MSYGARIAMTAISNGMQLHGGYRPFTGTFLIFMEYARNAVRLAALMRLPNIFVYTHDSVAVGEDGPTHAGGANSQFARLCKSAHLRPVTRWNLRSMEERIASAARLRHSFYPQNPSTTRSAEAFGNIDRRIHLG